MLVFIYFLCYREDTAVLTEVFDHMMSVIVDLSKSPIAQNEGKNIFAVFRCKLFQEMGNNVVSISLCHAE